MNAADLYPSRVGGEAGILVRKDPVVQVSENLRKQGPLSETVLAHYERRRFLAFDPFLTREELAPLAQETQRRAPFSGQPPRPESIAHRNPKASS